MACIALEFLSNSLCRLASETGNGCRDMTLQGKEEQDGMKEGKEKEEEEEEEKEEEEEEARTKRKEPRRNREE